MASSNLKIGDSVIVPGNMYGTLKFVGAVQGKKGIFAGVQLAPEFSARGKNSGDVDGKHYFRTSVPGAGIFLPVDKAEKRKSGGNVAVTSGGLSNFNQGGRMPTNTPAKSSFSQSVGPGSLAARNASPTTLKPPPRRESLPRPSSPLRKANNAQATTTPAVGRLATPKTRPSLGFNRSAIGAPGTAGVAVKSPAVRQPSRFGQSLRQSTRGSVTPSRMRQPPSSSASVATTTTDDYLGPESSFDESPQQGSPSDGADHTPTPAAGRSFKPKADTKKYEDETRYLREQLEEKDRQLNDQVSSIAEMERSLAELQTLIANMDSMDISHGRQKAEDEGELPTDVQNLRAALREKNERIKAMTAEFDNNRADFRSTIDTLEMASTETERVYERRIEELMEDIKHLQERHEDVEGVAQQFRQLEELVQELEEGLEDARRGEAEARGEVEFLRGEVERSRSELRRERERNRTGDKLNGIDVDGGGNLAEDMEDLQVKLDQKDDEIRGLKAIVQSLNNAAAARSPDRNSRNFRMNGGPFGHSKTKSTNTVVSIGASEDTAQHFQDQIRELETLLQQKSSREEELQEEVTKLRQSVQFGSAGSKFVVPGLESKHQRTSSNLSKHQSLHSSSTITAGRSSSSTFPRGAGTKSGSGAEFVDAEQFPQNDVAANSSNRKSTDISGNGISDDHKIPDGISVSADTEASSNVMWCEICEESGHDILTCGQMIGASPPRNEDHLKTPRAPQGSFSPKISKDPVRDGFRWSHTAQGPPPDTSVPPPPGTPARNSAPVFTANAKRSSGQDVAKPAPLSTSRQDSTISDSKNSLLSTGQAALLKEPPSAATTSTSSSNKLVEGTGDQAGMLAGKESGVIDPDKWCALCERDGHESVDCPIEDDI